MKTMNQVQKLELQAENYKKEIQRYRRELESTEMSKEQVEERLQTAQEFYTEMITNINNLKQ